MLTPVKLRRCNRRRLVQMKVAGPAVVVKPVGRIGVLLKLQQRDAGANRVDRAGGNEDEVARGHGPPVDHSFDRSVQCRGPQFTSRDRLRQADPDLGIPFRVQDIPAFRLSTLQPTRSGL